MNEAKQEGADARRREIVFAVACAECYLFEWVRDTVLNSDYVRINDYFVPGSISPIKDKWKDVPKKLLSERLIKGAPDNGGTTWAQFDNWSIIATDSYMRGQVGQQRRDSRRRKSRVRRKTCLVN